jgi:hypothetical protein
MRCLGHWIGRSQPNRRAEWTLDSHVWLRSKNKKIQILQPLQMVMIMINLTDFNKLRLLT